MAQSFRESGHLPKQRPDGQPADPARLPRQRNGITPQMHGRYPDYDVMANAGNWDPVTRKLILDRVEKVPEIRFFTEAEARCLGPFFDVVLAQDAEPRIPVLNMVDQKMHEGKLDGYQYANMPDDRVTWRLVARGLDEAAARHGAPDFAAASGEIREQVVKAFSQGELSGGAWDELDVSSAWSVVMRGALSEFYSHPWAWNEIGFGGPAYPRGYMRLNAGPSGRDPHETEEAYDVDPVTNTPEPAS